jgi:hypothetical protein
LTSKLFRKPPEQQGQDSGPPRTMLLFGESHCEAVYQAARKRVENGRPSPITILRKFKIRDGKDTGDVSFGGFLARASELGPDDLVISMIGGRHYAVFGTVQHPRAFDFWTPDEPARSVEGLEIVPFRAVEAIVSEAIIEGAELEGANLSGDGKRLEKLRDVTRARIVHVIPPPPTDDNDYIATRHERQFAALGLARFGVSAPDLRLKFWKLQADILARFCGDHGIETVMPPPEATIAGFLRPEFRKGAAHANAHYGELLLQAIDQRYLKADHPVEALSAQ